MGSPISATIASLVIENIEEVALTTATNPPRCWFRFVDDVGLKRKYVKEFQKHLNSINEQIQFTVEIKENNKLSFFDTVTTIGGMVELRLMFTVKIPALIST